MVMNTSLNPNFGTLLKPRSLKRGRNYIAYLLKRRLNYFRDYGMCVYPVSGSIAIVIFSVPLLKTILQVVWISLSA